MVRKKIKEREMLTREGEVTSWYADVFAFPFPSDQDSLERRAMPTINILGTFTKDVKGVSQFEITVVPGKPKIGKAEIPSVGTILKAKPAIEGYVTLSETEYQTVLALVTTGNLRHLSCEFQTPRYGSALIASLMLSSQKPIE